RVVVLDFGLAELLHRHGATVRTQGTIDGTVAYMAPDQVRMTAPLTPAVDLYALGVMLFEAVTGVLPFDGSIAELLAKKLEDTPPRMSSLVAGVPAELDQLVADLLLRAPSDRASTAHVFAWCEGQTYTASRRANMRRALDPQANALEGAVFAREHDLEAIDRAVEHVRALESAVVLVRGSAGTGKTAFIDLVCQRFERARQPLAVLRGRCAAYESVPYRGLNQVIEGLVRLLRGAPGERTLSIDGMALSHAVQLFPVLQRIPGALYERVDGSPRVVREAARELAQLFYEVALHVPLAIVLDDAHLADRDTGALLDALLSAETPPPMLLIASYRPGVAGALPGLLKAHVAAQRDPSGVVDLQPLTLPVAVAFARAHLAQTPFSTPLHADTLARSCGQNAALIEQVTHLLQEQPELVTRVRRLVPSGLTLAIILEGYCDGLPPEARLLLELIVVCDAPTPIDVLGLAAGFGSGVHGHLSRLRDDRLVDIDEVDGCIHVDCVHALVRRTYRASIPEDRVAAHHRALAGAHHDHASGLHESEARHLIAAGERGTAGERAYAAGCAFLRGHSVARAIALFALAVECEPSAWIWRIRYAEALAAAGSRREAGRQFLSCARIAPKTRRRLLVCNGVEQLILAGCTEPALAATRCLVEEFAVEFPTSDARAQALLAHETGRLAAHSLRYTEHNRFEIGGELLAELDVFAALGKSLLPADPVRAGYLLARGALTALLAGEPRTLARNL
ncbi:MAG: AAA family ATPase, partial [Myxococcales bacterium]|nr:AAA family ATPase [Myxococcales bacterium]